MASLQRRRRRRVATKRTDEDSDDDEDKEEDGEDDCDDEGEEGEGVRRMSSRAVLNSVDCPSLSKQSLAVVRSRLRLLSSVLFNPSAEGRWLQLRSSRIVSRCGSSRQETSGILRTPPCWQPCQTQDRDQVASKQALSKSEGNALQHHGNSIASAWLHHGNGMATAWQQHGSTMAIAWHPWEHHGSSMASAWQQHGSSMATSWHQHGNG